jgi:ribosomal protein S18 acetylase RimI-like enzyme
MKSDYEDAHEIWRPPLAYFICIPYVLFSEIYFLRQKRFFITLENQPVGILALQDRDEILYISTLAVSPFFRKIGLATRMLDYAAMIAAKLNKADVELSVFKANAPALSLYLKYGFKKNKEKRRSFRMKRDIRKAR